MKTLDWLLLGIIVAIIASYIAETSNSCSAFVDKFCTKDSNYYK